jgi:hypothetical protein
MTIEASRAATRLLGRSLDAFAEGREDAGRWRRAPEAWLSIWISVEADCGRFAKFGRLRHALGVKWHLQPMPRGFARYPLKWAVGGRP